MGITREGWHWTPSTGLQSGLSSRAVIEPARKIQDAEEIFDVVVIGAGYTGLTAARDLSTSGESIPIDRVRA